MSVPQCFALRGNLKCANQIDCRFISTLESWLETDLGRYPQLRLVYDFLLTYFCFVLITYFYSDAILLLFLFRKNGLPLIPY